MYRVSHEFTFQMNQNDNIVNFIGQLIFEGNKLNELGNLHTEEEMANFGVALNRSIALSEYWTLETMSKELYDNIKPLFSNLKSLNLTMEHAQYRVAEYTADDSIINLDDIVYQMQ